MKLTQRVISAILVLVLLFSIVSCASDTKDPNTGNETQTTSDGNQQSSETTAETTLVDTVEQKDYDYTFTYLALAQGINATTRFVDEMWVENETGEVINDATWKRNMFLLDRLNVSVEVVQSGNPLGDARASIQSGDNAYDMMGAYKVDSLTLATEGFVRNWNDLKIDYNHEWWSSGAIEKLQILNSQFLMSGSILISEIDDTLAMVYNKGLAEDYGFEDIYQLVKDKKWTVDKFVELTSKISQDLNGDSKFKAGEDLFGYIQDPASMNNNWVFSSDLLNGYVGEDGMFNINVNAERVQSLLDKLSPLFKSDSVVLGIDLYEGLKYFEENTIFMYAIILRNLELLREMDFDFGVIPYPMLDEAQGRYVTHVGSASPILTIPITNADNDEMLADILDAMAKSSHQYLIPAYYQTALKDKIARDPESAEMLDIILASKTYDISYLIGNGLVSTVAPLLARGNTDFSSSWAKTETRTAKTIQQTIDKLVTASEG